MTENVFQIGMSMWELKVKRQEKRSWRDQQEVRRSKAYYATEIYVDKRLSDWNVCGTTTHAIKQNCGVDTGYGVFACLKSTIVASASVLQENNSCKYV